MQTIEQHFERAFIINLDHRTDRWSDCLKEIRLSGVPESFFERFPGRYNRKDPNTGCTSSHRALVKKIATGPWERVLVLEDDFCVFTPERLLAANLNQYSPFWEVHHKILSGQGNLNERFAAVSEFIPDKYDVFYLGAGYGEPPMSRYNQHVIRCGSMKTTSSYGITREYAKRWTEFADKHAGGFIDLEDHSNIDVNIGGIDDAFGNHARENLYYVFQPRLIYQRKSFSEIQNHEVYYIISMADCNHENMV